MDGKPGTSRSGLLNTPFVIAIVLLSGAAVLAGPFAKWMRYKQNKAPLPLVRSLATFEEDALAPYVVTQKRILPPSIEEALGTSQYLSWNLVKRDQASSGRSNDPLREANLFVTYYTGGNNLVPHTPDVCYIGGGYQPAQPHENVQLAVPDVLGTPGTIPARVCTFTKTAVFNHRKITVVYAFHCNGGFVAGRTGVRLTVNTIKNTYAYFSKIEVSFPYADREEAIEGAGALLAKVLPVLIRDHWPDFQEAERKAQN